MSNYVVNGEKLTAIANAIRTKTGGTADLTLDQMPVEIAGIEADIPDGYIIPSGSLTITENGDYDITEKASVKVEVPEREITLQNKEITTNGTYAADAGYDGLGQVIVNVASSGGGGGDIDKLIDKSITEISSNVTSIGAYGFRDCVALTNINFPLATNIGTYAFYGCSILTRADFPLVTNIGANAFQACSALTTINFPSVASTEAYVFRNCVALTGADFPLLKRIRNYLFNGCSEFASLILRSGSRATLDNANALAGTKIASGTGYIYVPASLVDSYKSQTTWSTYASQFRALEDYTVDGTTTGTLDESKI